MSAHLVYIYSIIYHKCIITMNQYCVNDINLFLFRWCYAFFSDCCYGFSPGKDSQRLSVAVARKHWPPATSSHRGQREQRGKFHSEPLLALATTALGLQFSGFFSLKIPENLLVLWILAQQVKPTDNILSYLIIFHESIKSSPSVPGVCRLGTERSCFREKINFCKFFVLLCL